MGRAGKHAVNSLTGSIRTNRTVTTVPFSQVRAQLGRQIARSVSDALTHVSNSMGGPGGGSIGAPMSTSGRSRTSTRQSGSGTRTMSETETVVGPRYRGRVRTSGRSGGFTSKLRKKPRYGKKYKKFIRGVQAVYEFGQVFSSDRQIMTVGHCSAPFQLVQQNMWRAVWKNVLHRMGNDVNDTTSDLSFGPNDTFIVACEIQPDVGVSFDTKILGPTTNIEELVDWSVANPRSYNSAANAEQVTFLYISYVPDPTFIGTTRMYPGLYNYRMDNLKISMSIKSSLKIQNRSTEIPEHVEADDVDNVPLYGKTYSGKGTGALYCNRAGPVPSGAFFGSAMTGLILNPGLPLTGAGVGQGVCEPPSSWTFDKVTKQGKLRVEPGFIKTNVIKSSFGGDFNEMWRKCSENLPTFQNKFHGFGHYWFTVLEKMIDATAGTSMVVALENNISFDTNVSNKFTSTTALYFKKEYTTV